MLAAPYISVIIPTIRLGGIDAIFASLAAQTFKDFELILVDGLFAERKRRCSWLAAPPFRFLHVPPRRLTFPLSSIAHAYNTGLVNARGKIVLFATDHCFYGPETLETHANFHMAGSFRGLSCPSPWRQVPPYFLDQRFLNQIAGKTIVDLAHDVQAFKFDEWLGSIFSLPIASNFNPKFFQLEKEGVIVPGRDNKLFREPGPNQDPFDFWGKNDSIPLEAALMVNGWDEGYDGTHGWHDVDFFRRTQRIARVAWHTERRIEACAHVLNVRSYMPGAVRGRDASTNYARFWQRKRKGFLEPVNDWSIWQVRERHFETIDHENVYPHEVEKEEIDFDVE